MMLCLSSQSSRRRRRLSYCLSYSTWNRAPLDLASVLRYKCRMPKKCVEPIEEDALIEALMDAKGKRVEIIAFGILYNGTLKRVDIENGTIIITNGDDQAMIEIERVESFCLAT